MKKLENYQWVTRILGLPFYTKQNFSWVFTSSNYLII